MAVEELRIQCPKTGRTIGTGVAMNPQDLRPGDSNSVACQLVAIPTSGLGTTWSRPFIECGKARSAGPSPRALDGRRPPHP